MYEFKLFLTSKCNFKCEYCYENNNIKRSMSKETLIKSIDFFMENAVENSEVYLNFFGGEPLIEFELIEFGVNYFKKSANKKHLKYNFKTTTNASLLNPHIIEFFKNNNFYLNVSLDGDRKVQNKYRKTVNGNDTFDNVWNNICLLKEQNCNFNIRMTVLPNTVEELEHSVHWLIENGITNINISPDFFANWENNHREKLIQTYKNLKELYIKHNNSREERLKLSLFDGKLSNYIFNGKSLFCSAGSQHFMISPDGELYPCSYVMDDREFIFGDVSNGINRKKRKYILEKYVFPKGNDKCNQCKIAYFCHGRKCSYYNLRSTGFLNTCDDFICFHEKSLYKILEELVDELYDRKDQYFLNILKKVKPVTEKFPEISASEKVQAYL